MFAILFTTALPREAKALQDSLDNAVVIDSVSFSNDSLLIHDTLHLTVHYNALVLDSCFFIFSVNGGLKLVDSGELKTSINEKLLLDTGTKSKTYLIYVQDTINSTIGLTMKLFSSPAFYNDLMTYKCDFKYDPLIQKLKLEPVDDDVDDNDESYYFIPPGIPGGRITHYIHIRGRVLFQDKSEPAEWLRLRGPYAGYTPSNYPLAKSAYNEVWLFFKPSLDPLLNITHPLAVNPITARNPVPPGQGPIEGIHFAKCDDEGYFEFIFDYDPGTITATNGYYDVILVLSKENEALWLESPTEHITINGTLNRYRNEPVRFYNIIKIYTGFDGTIPDLHIDLPEVYFPQDDQISVPELYEWGGLPDGISLNSSDGAVFRYVSLNRKFAQARMNEDVYGVHIPLQAATKRVTHVPAYYWTGKEHSGQFIYPNLLYFRMGGEGIQIISHEYGHYFDDFTTHTTNLYSEGFAVFFSCAAGTWISNSFSDRMISQDFLEISPFCYLYRYTDGEPEPTEPLIPRFANGTYTYRNQRFACYLWNLYDSQDEGNFSPLCGFHGKNNDDVDGLGLDVFNFWINCQPEDRDFSDYFHRDFKGQYNSNLQNSMDAIYDFMEYWEDWPNRWNYDDNNVYPLDQHLHWMKSPNLENLRFTLSETNDVTFFWDSTNSYFGIDRGWGYFPFVTSTIVHGVNKENKIIHDHFYFEEFPNQENGVKISVNGEFYDYVSNPVFPDEYTIPTLPPSTSFEAATFKQFAGDSYLPVSGTTPSGKVPVLTTEDDLYKYKQYENIIELTLNSSIKNIQADVYSLDGKCIANFYNTSLQGNTISFDLLKFPRGQLLFIRFILIDKDNNVYTKVEKIIL